MYSSPSLIACIFIALLLDWRLRCRKSDAVVAQSTFGSQNAKNTRCSNHFWTFNRTTLPYTTRHYAIRQRQRQQQRQHNNDNTTTTTQQRENNNEKTTTRTQQQEQEQVPNLNRGQARGGLARKGFEYCSNRGKKRKKEKT